MASAATSSSSSYQASCTVCYDAPMKVPIFQCRNGHLLCFDCELKVKRCPTCMEPLGKQNRKIRNRAVEGMQPPMLVCRNQSSGCTAGFFMDDELESHHAECQVRAGGIAGRGTALAPIEASNDYAMDIGHSDIGTSDSSDSDMDDSDTVSSSESSDSDMEDSDTSSESSDTSSESSDTSSESSDTSSDSGDSGL